MKRQWLEHVLEQPPTRTKIYERATLKAKWNNFHASKNILSGQVLARLSEDTAQQVDQLVCEDVPVGEVEDLKGIFSTISRTPPSLKHVTNRTVRKRLYTMN